jgi:hypothetical protein
LRFAETNFKAATFTICMPLIFASRTRNYCQRSLCCTWTLSRLMIRHISQADSLLFDANKHTSDNSTVRILWEGITGYGGPPPLLWYSPSYFGSLLPPLSRSCKFPWLVSCLTSFLYTTTLLLCMDCLQCPCVTSGRCTVIS